MRLLYLYPEEWTGTRAREVHTLSTCVALARAGTDVTLVTAGGKGELAAHLQDVAGQAEVSGLSLVTLTRRWGPIRSAAIFKRHFHAWRLKQPHFDWAYIIHLKAAAMLVHEHVMPYAYEAHEIFAQTQQRSARRQRGLHELERHVLSGSTLRIATSTSLARALSSWFTVPNNFAVIPNAGDPPLDECLAVPDGPFVYAGSIADWKGLDVVLAAARAAQVPLRIIGGTEKDWRELSGYVDTEGVDWRPRVPLAELPQALMGARAGLIPTNPATPSGEFSCPMKLFDYARGGLPVVSTALASLQSLAVGPWCTQVTEPTREAWAQALSRFRFDHRQAEDARNWAAAHTWEQRARQILSALQEKS
jgi:glycosyltransferase involved in cell wall biosynthesis